MVLRDILDLVRDPYPDIPPLREHQSKEFLISRYLIAECVAPFRIVHRMKKVNDAWRNIKVCCGKSAAVSNGVVIVENRNPLLAVIRVAQTAPRERTIDRPLYLIVDGLNDLDVVGRIVHPSSDNDELNLACNFHHRDLHIEVTVLPGCLVLPFFNCGVELDAFQDRDIHCFKILPFLNHHRERTHPKPDIDHDIDGRLVAIPKHHGQILFKEQERLERRNHVRSPCLCVPDECVRNTDLASSLP